MSELRDVVLDIGFLVARIYTDVFSLSLTLAFRVPVATFRWLASFVRTPSYKSRAFRSVFITGASAGLGASLAARFAKPGVLITITARSEEAMEKTKKECEAKGAVCYARVVDVRDAEGMKDAIKEAHERKRLDLVIANAGLTPEEDGVAESSYVMDINAVGSSNTIMPALDLIMKENNDPNYFPQLVLMSSLGGLLPSGSFFMMPYSASKNAVRTMGESLRTVLKHRIGVTVIFPGMTESRMVSNQIKKGIPMITGVWPIDRAMDVMEDGIQRNAPEVAYPFIFYVFGRVHGTTIAWLRDLYGPISRSSVGDPYQMCDKEIWKNAKLYKTS